MILIKLAQHNDFDKIWPIFQAVITTGDSHVFEPSMGYEEAESYWMSPAHRVYIAEYEGHVAGTFILKPVQIGLGSHIANASYMVHPDFQQKRIGKTMGEFSIQEAIKLGYKAMQFNIVVSTNLPAVSLWKSLGFRIIATVPNGFKHQALGFVDTYVMYLSLVY
jgi:L-amino acid N-acyltransferase YncA